MGSDAAGASSLSPLADGSAGAAGSSAMASAGATAAGARDAGPPGSDAATGAGAGGSGAPPGTSVDDPSGVEDASVNPAPLGLCEQRLSAATELPSVVVVVDRTGSMFDAAEPGVSAWTALRATVLEAIRALEHEARFGLLMYSGDAELCPDLTALPPARDNHATIAALYGALELPGRLDGGPVAALNEAAAMLARAGGDPHVWLVTDGEVDYCDDGNPLCPVDSAIAGLQRLAAASPPIRTSVFGPATTPTVLAASALLSFANAGAGAAVARPATGPVPTDVNAIFDQCNGVLGWASDFASTGKPSLRGQSIGDYAESGGPAAVHLPAGDIAALAAELRAGWTVRRRCGIDLASEGVTGSALATLDASASLTLDGQPVPHDEQSGWHLVAGTTLQLEGESCDAVQAAAQPPLLELRWSCTP